MVKPYCTNLDKLKQKGEPLSKKSSKEKQSQKKKGKKSRSRKKLRRKKQKKKERKRKKKEGKRKKPKRYKSGDYEMDILEEIKEQNGPESEREEKRHTIEYVL